MSVPSIHCRHNRQRPSNPYTRPQGLHIRASRAHRQRTHRNIPKVHQDEGLRSVPWVSVASIFNNNPNRTLRRARCPMRIDRTRGFYFRFNHVLKF